MALYSDKNYHTFPEHSSNGKGSLIIGGCVLSVIFIMCSIGLIFNATTIIISTTNANVTCLKQAHTVSLSNYALTSGIVGAMFNSTVVTAIILVFLGLFTDSPKTVLAGLLTGTIGFIFLIVYSTFSFIMAIVGTIELAYSYQLCKDEAHSLCVIVVLSVILHWCSCGVLQLKYSSK